MSRWEQTEIISSDCEELIKYLSHRVAIPLTMIHFSSSSSQQDLQRTGRCFYGLPFKHCDRILSLTSKTSARVPASASLQQQVLVSPPLLSKGGRWIHQSILEARKLNSP